MDKSKKTKNSDNVKSSSKNTNDSSTVVLTGDDILSEEENQYKSKYLYLQADFENYKKRITKQTKETVKWANEKLVKSLLTVVDDFERTVKSGKDSQDFESLISGMEMLLNLFKKALNDIGVTEIDTREVPFDPHIHEAVDRVETLIHEDGTVLEELRKGYLLHDLCIRPSMVRVAVHPPDELNNTHNEKEK